MPNQKISELTAIVTVDNSVDVLPIVDISANTTKKVTPNALKTALALDNVNNTSDANKPVSIAQQDALNAKVDENAPITAGTAPKITFDAKGLVTSGDSLDETDLPTGINANKIGTGAVSSTEFGYLDGVTSAIQTQINSKQATLVSGTNIKTINGATVLGAGDLTITGNPPSGVSGAIQFTNGSAFASDAANLFWDDTNNRLGVGTNAPSATVTINGNETWSKGFTSNLRLNGASPSLQLKTSSGIGGFMIAHSGAVTYFAASTDSTFNNSAYKGNLVGNNWSFGSGDNLGATVGIKGSGSTSATTSLLVQNSAASTSLQLTDDGRLNLPLTGASNRSIIVGGSYIGFRGDSNKLIGIEADGFVYYDGSNRFKVDTSGNVTVYGELNMNSTTKGFLPPRMTTTQKNAIASPAAGLVLYDSTTNKLQCYNGSTWNDLF